MSFLITAPIVWTESPGRVTEEPRPGAALRELKPRPTVASMAVDEDVPKAEGNSLGDSEAMWRDIVLAWLDARDRLWTQTQGLALPGAPSQADLVALAPSWRLVAHEWMFQLLATATNGPAEVREVAEAAMKAASVLERELSILEATCLAWAPAET